MAKALEVLCKLDKIASVPCATIGQKQCKQFLQTIRQRITDMSMPDNKSPTDICVLLTKCLVVFVKLETNNNCAQLDRTAELFDNINAQLEKSFPVALIKLLATVIGVCRQRVQIEELVLIIGQMQNGLNDDYVQLLHDVSIACIEMIRISPATCTLNVGDDNSKAEQWFLGLNHFNQIISGHTQSSQIYCYLKCNQSAGQHTQIYICQMSHMIMRSAIEAKLPVTKLLSQYCRFIALEWKLLDDSTCLNVGNWRKICKSRCEWTLHYLKGVQYASDAIELIRLMATHIPALRQHLPDTIFFFFLFRASSELLSADSDSATLENCIRFGYLAAIEKLAATDETGCEQIMKHICTVQIRLGQLLPIEQYLENEIAWKFGVYLLVPRINVGELLLFQLRHVIDFHSSFPQPLLEQLIGLAVDAIDVERNPLKALAVLYNFEDQLPSDEMHERLCRIYALASADAAAKHSASSAAEQIQWNSLVATWHTIQYLREFSLISNKHKNLKFELVDMANKKSGVADHNDGAAGIFSDCNLGHEMRLVERLVDAVQAYKRFNKLLLSNAATKNFYRFECECAVRNLRKCAQHLTVRQYRREAMISYTVLYSLADRCDDRFGRIAAISYFAANVRDYPTDRRSRETLAQLIDYNHRSLVEQLQARGKLSLRKRNALFQCLLSIGLYYAQQGRQMDATKLLDCVDKMLIGEEQPDANGLSIVRMRYNSVIMEMVGRYGLYCSMAPIQLAEMILFSVRHLQKVTAEDSILIPIILHEILDYVGHYCLERYDFSFVESLALMLLKLAFRMGLAYKAAKLLSFCALCNLYFEDDENCLVRNAFFVDDFFLIYDFVVVD